MSEGVLRDFYHSQKWKRARRLCLARNHHVCEVCGGPGNFVHHRVHLTADNYKDLSIAIGQDNLRCVCQECHNKIHFKSSALAEGLIFDKNGNVRKL